jgi:hypothetical protein
MSTNAVLWRPTSSVSWFSLSALPPSRGIRGGLISVYRPIVGSFSAIAHAASRCFPGSCVIQFSFDVRAGGKADIALMCRDVRQ